MRTAIRIVVFSGMLRVTVFGILFTPLFYVAIRWLTECKVAASAAAIPTAAHEKVTITTVVKPDGETAIQSKPPHLIP